MRPRFLESDVGESAVVKATNAAALKAGFMHRKVVYQGRRGAPDDWYFGTNGRLIIIEHKRPGKTPDPKQVREIKRLRDRGFDVRVVDSLQAAARVFRGEHLV